MVSYINRLKQDGHDTWNALLDGASLRRRPVLMTSPRCKSWLHAMALWTARGAEVQRPLATVVFGSLNYFDYPDAV